MPVMPSWVEYLPRPGELRGAIEQAVRATAAATFTDVAAEAVRLVVFGRGSDEVVRPHRERLARALAALSVAHPAEHVFGVLALANVALVHHDASVVLAANAAHAIRSRPLAFAALGAGRAGLALALSDDATIAKLASADADAFTQLVAEFPTSDLSYAELGFVARAYLELIEPHRRSDPALAASWLHKTVHEGPQPVRRPVVRKPIPRVTPTWIALDAIHALWGGTAIDVARDGTLTVISVERGDPEVRVRMLEPGERAELERVLVEADPRTMVIPRRPGVPDEGTLTITYVADGRVTSVSKWSNDRHAAFDTVTRSLSAIGRSR